MISKRQIFFFLRVIFFLNVGFHLSCSTKSNDEEQTEVLTFLLQNREGVQGACETFIQTENICVSSPANAQLVCSGGFQTTIRNGIQPEDKRTDELLEKYIRCFDACNLEYNLLTNCKDKKFTTNEVYRREQRKLDTSLGTQFAQAGLNWTNCYQKCRSVNGQTPTESSGLLDSGSTYPNDWFEGN